MTVGRPSLRRLRTAVTATVAAAALVAVPSVAFAHGGLTYPATRTYACYVNGIEGGVGGGLNPTNPACIDLLAENGNYPFYNWFGNLLSNAAGQHRAVVPDGNLCGPLPSFSGVRAARTDWPTTTLQAGAPITFQYAAWAKHPGTWSQYVTKDGWDPLVPLRWSDLEATPFNEVVDPPMRAGGPQGDEYYWTGTLPNKSGRHIIYSIWTRSDSPEAFYNCVDVTFQGGTVTPTPTPTPTPSVTPTATPTVSPTPTPSQTSNPPAGCSVTFDTSNAWNTGFTANVTVRNASPVPVNSWDLRWTFTNGEQVTHAWSSTTTQTGATVSAKAAAWNGTIPAHGSVVFGFNGSGTPRAPSGMTLNGLPCMLA
jgi:chitin-binding protein